MTFPVAVLVFILDRLTKLIAIGILVRGQSIGILQNVFHVTLVLNDGTAFGLFRGSAAFFAFTSIAAIIFMLVYILRHRKAGAVMALALGLILGGASGNLADRILYGYVIDFLDFRIWPVFNVADSAITIGAVMIAWRLLMPRSPKDDIP